MSDSSAAKGNVPVLGLRLVFELKTREISHANVVRAMASLLAMANVHAPALRPLQAQMQPTYMSWVCILTALNFTVLMGNA